jgi:hypothetical protein
MDKLRTAAYLETPYQLCQTELINQAQPIKRRVETKAAQELIILEGYIRTKNGDRPLPRLFGRGPSTLCEANDVFCTKGQRMYSNE